MATFDQNGREIEDVELEPVRARPARAGFAGLPVNEQGDYELPEVEAVAIRPRAPMHPAVLVALGALLVYVLDGMDEG